MGVGIAKRRLPKEHMMLLALAPPRVQELSMKQVPTLTPATLAGGKLSLSALVNAFSSTRLHADSLRYPARLPSRIVVLALMAGSSSTFTVSSH